MCVNTPWKINMEPTNHPFRKENDLNQTSMIMVQPFIFQGVGDETLPSYLGIINQLSMEVPQTSPPEVWSLSYIKPPPKRWRTP